MSGFLLALKISLNDLTDHGKLASNKYNYSFNEVNASNACCRDNDRSTIGFG